MVRGHNPDTWHAASGRNGTLVKNLLRLQMPRWVILETWWLQPVIPSSTFSVLNVHCHLQVLPKCCPCWTPMTSYIANTDRPLLLLQVVIIQYYIIIYFYVIIQLLTSLLYQTKLPFATTGSTIVSTTTTTITAPTTDTTMTKSMLFLSGLCAWPFQNVSFPWSSSTKPWNTWVYACCIKGGLQDKVHFKNMLLKLWMKTLFVQRLV